VTNRRTHLTEYGHTLAMQQYSQGEQELIIGMGIVPGAIDTLTAESKATLSLAIREYSQRAFPRPGQKTENPFAVKEDLIRRLQPSMTTIGLTPEGLRGTLRYPVRGIDIKSNPDGVLAATSQALEQARRDGQISSEAYKIEKEKWFKLHEAVEQQKRKQDAPGQPEDGEGGSSGTTPKNPVGQPTYNRDAGKALDK
jgi:hypothetical protein